MKDLIPSQELKGKLVKEVHSTSSTTGLETWTKFDENQNKLSKITNEGYEKIWNYDENGNLLNYREFQTTPEGKKELTQEIIFEYDEYGNEIHTKDSKGSETWSKYNENHDIVYYKTTLGFETICEYYDNGSIKSETQYDRYGNIILQYEYDINKNMTHYKCGSDEFWNKYDEFGSVIYHKEDDDEIYSEITYYDEDSKEEN